MADTAARPPVGAPAPPVDLPTLGGGRWRLAERARRTVVLIFNRHIH